MTDPDDFGIPEQIIEQLEEYWDLNISKILEFNLNLDLNGGFSKDRYGMCLEFQYRKYSLYSHRYTELPRLYIQPALLEVEMRENDKDFIVFVNEVEVLRFENWFKKYCSTYAY